MPSEFLPATSFPWFCCCVAMSCRYYWELVKHKRGGFSEIFSCPWGCALAEIIGHSPSLSFLLLPGHVVSRLVPVQLKFREDMDL